jgi:hypothetical protein
MTTSNPAGMSRHRLEGRPARRYEIRDGGHVVGETERIDLSPERYWRAHPVGGAPAPRDFPKNRHQAEVMPWLRDPRAPAQL